MQQAIFKNLRARAHTYTYTNIFWQLLPKNGEFVTVPLIMWNSDGCIAFAVVAALAAAATAAASTAAVSATVHSLSVCLFVCMIIVSFSRLLVLLILGVVEVRSSSHIC